MVRIEKIEHSKDALHKVSEILLLPEYFKETGYAPYSSKNHTWYVVYLDDLTVGCGASVKRGSKFIFCHDYILEEYRGLGLYRQMFKKRMQDNIGNKIEAVATKKSKNVFLDNGFFVKKETKNYSFLKFN